MVIGIIFLFVGIAVAPSITSIEISKTKTSNDDLVEITLQLCKTDGTEDYKMLINQEQDEQLDILIESFKADLDKAETREETIEIYKDMVISLDELDLFSEVISCEEVQKLITDTNRFNIIEKMKAKKHFNFLYDKLKNTNSKQIENTNILSLISGQSSETYFMGPIIMFNEILKKLLNPLLENILLCYLFGIPLGLWILVSNGLLLNLITNPLPVGVKILFGKKYLYPGMRNPEYCPAEGWVSTYTPYYNKTWEGSFYGQISKIDLLVFDTYYVGALGFTGIRIRQKRFYLGSTLLTNINYGHG